MSSIALNLRDDAGRKLSLTLSANSRHINSTEPIEPTEPVLPPDDNSEIIPSEFDFSTLPTHGIVTINNTRSGGDAYFALEINGVLYNADKSVNIADSLGQPWDSEVAIYPDSDNGNLNISAMVAKLKQVRLIPSNSQKMHSDSFVLGSGAYSTDGSFYFNIFSVE